MKAFFISLTLFSAMLLCVLQNGRYLTSLSDELTRTLESIPSYSDFTSEADARTKGLARLDSLWEEHRERVSLSVPVRVTEGIDDCLDTLLSAEQHGARADFDAARAHLLRIVEDLGRHDTLQLGRLL